MRSVIIIALFTLAGCFDQKKQEDFLRENRIARQKDFYWTEIPAPKPGYSCFMYGGLSFKDGPSGAVCLKDEN
jgi:hypothetical protein